MQKNFIKIFLSKTSNGVHVYESGFLLETKVCRFISVILFLNETLAFIPIKIFGWNPSPDAAPETTNFKLSTFTSLVVRARKEFPPSDDFSIRLLFNR